jgi:MFS family permease
VLVPTVLVAGASMAMFPLFPELQARHGISTASLGLIAAAGFVATLVAEMGLAPLADRGRARALLGVGAAAAGLSLLLVVVADDAATLVVSRLIGGAGHGAWLPAASALLVRTAPARAGEQLGRLYAAELLGLAVGPLLAALGLGWIDLGPTMVVGTLALLGAAAWAARTQVAGVDHAPDVHPPRLALDLLGAPAVRRAVLLAVAFWLPIGAYDAIWSRFVADLGASTALVGLSYTLFAVPFAVAAPLAGRLADRVGGPRAALRGFALLLPVVVSFGFVQQVWVVIGLGVVESTGQAIASTAAAAAMAQAVSPDRAGSGQGLARAVGGLVAAVAALVAAPVYDVLGREVLFPGTAAAVVIVVVTALVGVGRTRVAPPPWPSDATPSTPSTTTSDRDPATPPSDPRAPGSSTAAPGSSAG